MGVPVGLEMIRQTPERVTALGALFGAAGTPFRLAFPGVLSDSVHGVVHLAAHVPLLGQAVLEAAVALPAVAWALCSGLGFVGRHAHPAVFARNVDSVRRAQKPHYFRTLRELIYHDAHDVLPGIRCPVLVVAGGRDWVTPPHAAEAMVRALPAAEYVLLPDASHFGIIEHGPALYAPVDRLLGRA
jgi:pimeloyl-ACP methyl ester carboxylesterase